MLKSFQVCRSLYVLIFLFQSFVSFAQVNITSSNGGVTITGLTSDANTKLFNSNIQAVWSCNPWQGNPCTATETVSGLTTGATYFLSTGGQWIPVTIQGSGGGGGGSFCGFENEYFNLSPFIWNPRPAMGVRGEEVNGNYVFRTSSTELVTNDEGNQLSINTQAGPFPTDDFPFLSGSYEVDKVGSNGINLIVKNANGGTIFNKTYTNLASQSRSAYNFNVVEKPGGYYLYGTWFATTNGNTTTNLLVVNLDNNGNLINFSDEVYRNTAEFGNIVTVDLHPNGDLFMSITIGLQAYNLYRVNAQEGIRWENTVVATTYTDDVQDIAFDESENSIYAYAFEATSQGLKKINAWTGNTIWSTKLEDVINPNTTSIRRFNSANNLVVTSDGGVLVSYVFLAPFDDNYQTEIGKLDRNGNGVWWRQFDWEELNILEPLFESSDGGAIFGGRTADKFIVFKLNQNGLPTPSCGGGCQDTDGDGSCDADDCQPTNPNLPATPGSSCNDFNANTENDEIQSDGCTCQGTPISSGCNVNITSSNGGVTITGLNSGYNTKLFNTSITSVWGCNPWQGSPCSGTETVSGLTVGATYFLSAVSSNCNEWIPITIQGGGGGGGNGKDLTIANFSTNSGAPGSVVPFTFDLINQGNQTVNQSYNITTYISSDNQLSGNDIQEGNIATGNTLPGTQSGVNGAITVPSNLAPGNYFLIIKVDDDNVVSETNENNNVRSTSLTVTGSGGGDCTVVNLAPGKSTSQSSTINFSGINAVSSLAIDGNTNGNFFNGSVAATTGENQSWWQIDLGASYEIKNVKIFNRTEGNDRLNNFYVLVSNTPFSGNLANARNQASYERYYSGLAGTPTTWSVDAPTGRYVRIQRQDYGYVTLAEVRINGCSNNFTPDDTQGLNVVAQPAENNFIIDKLFPIPAQDELIIQLKGSREGKVSINLSNATGKVISQRNLSVEEGLNTFSIDCSSFPTGMYHLTLYSNNSVQTKKVVIAR